MSLIVLPGKREHVRLPSVSYPHIFKDPPRSIHTRKYEPVESGDIFHLIRQCPDRTSEGIQKFPRGETFHHGKDGESMHTSSSLYGHWGSPYKINEAVRMPLIRPTYDLLPLSRMKRPNTSVQALPYVAGFEPRVDLMKAIDLNKVKASVVSLPAPDVRFVLGDIQQRPMVTSYISDQLRQDDMQGNANLSYEMGSVVYAPDNPAQAKLKNPLMVSVTANAGMEVGLYNEDGPRLIPLKREDQLHIAVEAARGGTIELPVSGAPEPIRLKDYLWYIVQRPDGGDVLMIDTQHRNYRDLPRKMPLISVNAAAAPAYALAQREGPQTISLANRVSVSAQARPTRDLDNELNHNVNLRDMMHLGSFERTAELPPLGEHQNDELNNRPLAKQGYSQRSYISTEYPETTYSPTYFNAPSKSCTNTSYQQIARGREMNQLNIPMMAGGGVARV